MRHFSVKIERIFTPKTNKIVMLSTSRIVHSDTDILGGTPVFIGTRVPMKILLDYLEAGDSLNEFLDHFPSVSRQQAIAVLELAKEMLTSDAKPSHSNRTLSYFQRFSLMLFRRHSISSIRSNIRWLKSQNN